MELKFIEIEYNPFSNEVEAYVFWSPEEKDFKFDDKFVKLQNSKADLVELKVANQSEQPGLSPFLRHIKDSLNYEKRKTGVKITLFP